ncbi:hypothetical protein ACIBG7_27410 [Nonomuraea sp. NPDC050328]|uniref:hypothetical protein n=1 Tax=Nonomuraea sp. NPDC050328 TaxID=3364361 RepID=UPI00379909CA
MAYARHLFYDAAQRPDLAAAERIATDEVRRAVKRRADEVAAVVGLLDGLELNDDEITVIKPPFSRARHLPSPSRAFGHLAVRDPEGFPSITPLWVTTKDRQVVLSTVENRIKARATAVDPMAAISIAPGIGSPLGVEVCGLVMQSPDEGNALIREIAELYSNPGMRVHADGNYTSWDRREGNRRIRLDLIAYQVTNELGDESRARFAPWMRHIEGRSIQPSHLLEGRACAPDTFWEEDRLPADELELLGTKDELAILGYAREGSEFRSVNSTYGHIAVHDEFGRLRARRIGFDVTAIGGEARITFLVPKENVAVGAGTPVATSFAKYKIGGAWLQARGIVELHDDSHLIEQVVRRLKHRYGRPPHDFALRFGSLHADSDFTVASIACQKLSSRYREALRSGSYS